MTHLKHTTLAQFAPFEGILEPQNSGSGGRRGQISIEVMYAIGVLMIIFLILSAVAFNRQVDLQRNEEYFYKRAECHKLANALSSVYLLGPTTTMTIQLQQNITVVNDRVPNQPWPLGLIIVTTKTKSNPVQATCSFYAKTASPIFMLNASGVSSPYIVQNTGGLVSVIAG